MKTMFQRTFRHSLASAALLVLATTSASLALADDHGRGKGGPGGYEGMGRHGLMYDMTPEMAEKFAERRVEHLAKRVNATAEQKSKLLAIAKDSAKQAQAQQGKMKELHEREKTLMTAPKLDRAALEKLNAEKAALRNVMHQIREKALLDSMEILTPEQRAQMGKDKGMRMGKREGKNMG